MNRSERFNQNQNFSHCKDQTGYALCAQVNICPPSFSKPSDIIFSVNRCNYYSMHVSEVRLCVIDIFDYDHEYFILDTATD